MLVLETIKFERTADIFDVGPCNYKIRKEILILMKHVKRILGPIVEAKPKTADPIKEDNKLSETITKVDENVNPIEEDNKLSETITKVDENVNPIEEKPKKGRKKKNV